MINTIRNKDFDRNLICSHRLSFTDKYILAQMEDYNETSDPSITSEDRGDNKQLVCNTCHKKFNDDLSLTEHIYTHTSEKPFTCSVCDKGFKRKNDLFRHFRVHTGEKPFHCTVCYKGFSRRFNLLKHSSTHTDEKLFKCNICYEEFPEKIDLTTHKKTHTNHIRFQCDSCYKSYSRQSDLTRHMKCHTGENLLQCKYCEKSFTCYSFLRRHVKLHIGEHKCTYCNAKFSSKEQLTKHARKFHAGDDITRLHTGDQAHTCNICYETFCQVSNLNEHLKCHWPSIVDLTLLQGDVPDSDLCLEDP